MKAYKYRIYPTKQQESTLNNHFAMCRHLYNWSLKERIEAYETEKRTVSYVEQANKLPVLKKERAWFKNVYSQVLQNVLKRLDLAFQNFFRRVKNNQTSGFPKYKKKGTWQSITYPDYSKTPVNDTITVPKIGIVKIIYH